jgi:pyrimidine deaminase RibD-like protein
MDTKSNRIHARMDRDVAMTHLELMLRAVELANLCEPNDPKKTPRLGVVIARNGVIIGEASRGTGLEGQDEHAEPIAIASVLSKSQIPGATVYTTLEPCTHHVRRATSESCTDLLIRKNVGKVVIGILDPNQGVCGRGVNQLQLAGIKVQLFPLFLAQQIRLRNGEFIKAHQQLSPRIIRPSNGDIIELEPQLHGGFYKRFEIEFECNNPPGPDVRIVVQNGSDWWPQAWGISWDGHSKLAKGGVGIGAEGTRTIHIVKANALGQALLGFHQDVIEKNERRKLWLKEKLPKKADDQTFWEGIPSDYQGVNMGSLPNGLDSLAQVTIRVAKKHD